MDWNFVMSSAVKIIGVFSVLMTIVAYAVWTGIGTVGTVVVGIVALGEPATLIRLACIGLIVAGIAGLKIV